MKALRISLAVMLLFYSLPTFLSGLDIFRGTEEDLASEWIIVTLFFVMCLLMVVICLIEALERLRKPAD